MKLSDMFATLAENAKTFESRVNEWQSDATSRNEDMTTGARKWQETAKQRQDDMNRQMAGYFESANENVRKQWQTMQSAWEDQFQKMREKGDEMRQAAKTMPGADLADWSEAYAAQTVAFAQKMQDEAANAIAAATEARGKETPKRKA